MGLPGSGKTFIAKKLAKKLNAYWLNADKIRGKHNDWDFSKKGIIRQVKRMKNLADSSKKKFVIADFVCPMHQQIKIFKPNYIFWMDTIQKSRFSQMNKFFKKSKYFDLRIKEKNWKINLLLMQDQIINYQWKNNKSTAQMMGRFQPWHQGHKKLFEKILMSNNQINIQVKDVKGVGDNPFNFKSIKKKILKDLQYFKSRIKITQVPNIMTIYYGRKVGYNFKKINLLKNLKKISATNIRKKLRSQGKLK